MTTTNGESNLSPNTMAILEHLDELRKRVMWGMLGIVIGTVVAIFFTTYLLEFLTAPYCEYLVPSAAEAGNTGTLGNGCTRLLITLRPTEPLETYFRIALTAGAVFAMPFLLLQFWMFIAPGLHKHEKKYVFIFIPAATFLFLTGVVFCWYVLLPAAIYFLVNFLSDTVVNTWQLDPYIDFITSFLFWIGVAFEMPLILYFLARFGLVTSTLLREQWRFAVVGIAIIAAIMTPSIDPITMLLTMAPLGVLYIISIFLARIGQRQFERLGTVSEES